MTPDQTTALIALVIRYQRADAAFAADNSLTNETALIESLEDLLDWREPAMPTVGCEDADGLLHVHPESATCDVCAPTVHASKVTP